VNDVATISLAISGSDTFIPPVIDSSDPSAGNVLFDSSVEHACALSASCVNSDALSAEQALAKL
jgi:hypothetical protein